MPTQDDLKCCVSDQAQEYLQLTYAELAALADRERIHTGDLSRWQRCGTEEAYLDITVCRLGWLRRK